MKPFPPSAWSVRATALVTAVILAPIAGTLLLTSEMRSLSGIATATQFVIYPAVLVAALLLYIQYRLTGANAVGWATLCLTLCAVQGVMLAGLRAAQPDALYGRPGWVLIVDVPTTVTILVIMRRAETKPPEVDPLTAGLAAGIVVAAANFAANHWGPELAMSDPPVVAAEITLLVVVAGIAQACLRLDEIPRWCASRLALGAIALVVNRIASCQDADHFLANVGDVGAGIVGAVLMVSAAGAGLRFAMYEHRDSLDSLTDKVTEMELHERDNTARLHEITNSIASIAVASTLIHQAGDVPSLQRRKLEQMLESEAGRLSRSLGDADSRTWATSQQSQQPEPSPNNASQDLVDLDELIRPLVTSQEALRRSVDWRPSGHIAVGDVDAVAEVISILLDNSARHAPGSHASIEVARHGNTVEVTVCDDGPGIPPEVRQHLFEWGGRGHESNGQGIGLNIAYRLTTASGHSLRLEHNRAGTAFVLALPAAGAESQA